jgi:hypothetical protein
MAVPLGRWRCQLDGKAGTLDFSDSAGRAAYRFKLNPYIEYLSPRGAESPLRGPTDCGHGHCLFHAGDGVVEKEIHIWARSGGFVDYWVELQPVYQGVEINCVHYGQDGVSPQNASEHALEEFFILCPDRYGSIIPRRDKICFKLGVPSFRFAADNNFPHEGGRTIIPPYFAALRAGQEWLGVGTMEIPTSEYGLNMTFQGGRAVTDFHYGGNLKPSGRFVLPRITFLAGDDKLGVARAYIDRLYADGLAKPNRGLQAATHSGLETSRQWDDSWAGPIYCFFSDQMYEYQTDRASEEMLGELAMTEGYCNDAFLDRCLRFLAECDIGFGMLIFDYGWFIANGQWRPNTKRFSDLGATIRKLHQAGKKVLVWYSPYFVSEQSDHYRNHPEIAVRNRKGEPVFILRLGGEKNFQCDFTHPVMRELAAGDIRFMLGPDGLDADGIKIDCTHQPPGIENVFHDPSWGTGEMFHYKASKFIYDQAKAIKPRCCINTTAGNPLFNGTFDLHRIHDAMEYNLDSYEERAWAAWFCRAGVSDLDDWPSYDLFTVRANLRKIAYGVPSMYAARKRGGERKRKCTYGYSRSVRKDELELLSTLYKLYSLVPVDASQEILIDPFRKVFHRKYVAGPLKGFYAAKTLCGNQAVAVYTEQAAYVACISGVVLAVPIPPDAKPMGLARVGRSGGWQPVEFELIDGTAVFQASRCDGDTAWFRIDYKL